MILARVIGTMVATKEEAIYRDKKMLWVQPVDPEGTDQGTAFLTLDAVGAGEGETVLVLKEGSGAMQVFDTGLAPVSSAIVAIVDRVDMHHERGAR